MAVWASQKVTSFPCYRCGACCRHVDLAELTRFLDRGDGICRHYDEAGKSCGIYEHRPDICCIDRQYQLHYSKQYSWKDFVRLNLQACAQLEALPLKTGLKTGIRFESNE